MRSITEKELIEALIAAYELGASCAKEINSPTRKWTRAKAEMEHAALNRLMRRFGAAPLTDEDYQRFCR